MEKLAVLFPLIGGVRKQSRSNLLNQNVTFFLVHRKITMRFSVIQSAKQRITIVCKKLNHVGWGRSITSNTLGSLVHGGLTAASGKKN